MPDFKFLESISFPAVTARIEVKSAKPGRVTLIGTPYYTDSKKRIRGSPSFQRTVRVAELEAGFQTILNLIEKYCADNAGMITAQRLAETAKKGPAVKEAPEKPELGIYSIAYRALPDPMALFTNWADSTTRQTQTYFERQILPRIDAIASDPSREKIAAIVDELVDRAKSNRRGGHNIATAKSTVAKHLYRIDIVLQRLHFLSGVPLFQFGFRAPASPQTEQAKALPPAIRIRFAAALRKLCKDPRAAGCALMFGMGHRTAEACAPLIKDFVLNPLGSVTYFVGFQIKDGKRVEVLKTADAYRYTVGGPLIQLIIKARIEVLLEQGYSYDQVMEMPLVSDPEDPANFLDPQKLSAYAKSLLIACGYTEEAYFAAQILMGKEPDLVDDEAIKEPSCYILRRDWVSRALNNCGMDPRDVDYLVGHKRPDKSITVFNDPVVQFDLARQLERCVLLADCTLHPAFAPIILSNGVTDTTKYTRYMLKNAGKSKRVIIRVKTGEGGEDILINTIGQVISAERKTGDPDRPDDRAGRPVILPPYPRELLEKESSFAETLDLNQFTKK